MKRSTLITLFTALSAFTTTVSARAQSPAAPCGIEVPAYAHREWRLIQADGFTFCVPTTWQPTGKARGNIDAKEWSADGGSITWGTGLLRERTGMDQRQVIATVRADQIASPNDLSPSRPDVIKETIDGRVAELWTFESRGKRQTRAQWMGPAGYLRGEAGNDEEVRLHFAIFRTLRFQAR